MHRRMMEQLHEVVRESGIRPKRALEVGGYVNHNSLLRFPEIEEAERFCLNLVEQPQNTGISHIVGNANDMSMFEDDSFDFVICNAVLEHDKHFWLSAAEMRRVTRPGGLLVISVPGFVRRPDDTAATRTFRVHYRFDYYRFSRRAVREVLFEGMERIGISAVLDPPRIIGHGFKPASPQRAAQVKRRLERRAARLLSPSSRR